MQGKMIAGISLVVGGVFLIGLFVIVVVVVVVVVIGIIVVGVIACNSYCYCCSC